MKKLFPVLLMLMGAMSSPLFAQPCIPNTWGIIVPGVECPLIAANNTQMLPCIAPPEYYQLELGDTIHFAWESNPDCISFCQQGNPINILCMESSGNNSCIDPNLICDTCACIEIYDPVCGCDGNTYSNSCFATIAGVTSWTQGACNGSICEAAFTSTTSGNTVSFQNTSSGDGQIVQWAWSFGDGTISNEQSPVHTYPNSGTYEVCLTSTFVDASGNACADTWCNNITISGQGCIPNASGVLVQGVEFGCILVQLADGTQIMPCSAPVGFWDLAIGDQVAIAWQPNFECVSFCQQGIYADILCFQASSTCSAIYSYTVANNNFYSFADNSFGANISSWHWDFGDGEGSTIQNPNHTFANPGWYSVCLTITGIDSTQENCTSTYCNDIYVTDGCIDSSMICPPGSLCCDAPLYDPVCGCDGVTYDNPCTAQFWGGVMNTTPGPCLTASRQILLDNRITLSPNPANESVGINLELPARVNARISVVNALGQTVLPATSTQLAAGKQTIELDIRILSSGMYFVEISTGQEMVIKKLIRE